jgi:hypothetical protein
VLFNKVERPPGEVIPEITDGAVLEPRNVLLIKSNLRATGFHSVYNHNTPQPNNRE